MRSFDEIKAVVFDMDGVIFDTERMFLECWNILGDKHNIENIEATARCCIGLSIVDTVALLKQTYGEDFPVEEHHGMINKMVADRISVDGMPEKAGVREILEYLKSINFPVGLASSTKYDTIISHLERADLLKYFQVIVGGDMIEKSKPNPEIYQLACQKLGVSPQNTVAIEDSKNGIISAYRAGMMPIIVPDLIEPTDEMISMSCGCLEDLHKVKDFLKSPSVDSGPSADGAMPSQKVYW